MRGQRRARRRGKGSLVRTVHSPAFINRKIPFFEFLDEAGLELIEDQAEWLMQEVGIEFQDDPEALTLWRAAGADVTDTRVRAPRGMVRKLCTTAPRQFTQVARNPDRSVSIGGTSQIFAPVYGAPFVRDLQGGRRYGAMTDFERLIKLTYQLPSLHHGGFVTCEPCDVPVSKRHLDMLYVHMRYSDKAHLGAITTKERAEDSVAMARIVFGEAFLESHCVILGNVNTNSPLLVDKVVTEAMMCCAYSQLVRPGAPFILGNFLSSMNLRSGAPTFGMPEPVMSNYIVGQLARRLGLPLRCGGALTSSKLADAQAAYESSDSMHSTALAGSHFTLHAAGWLEGGLCTGFEKLVMDADRLGAYQVLLDGLPLDIDTLARDAYGEVQPGGHFLGSSHTLRHYQTAFFEAQLSDSQNVENWEERGSEDMQQRAFKRWNKLLDSYIPPPMDSALDDALKEFVAKRKAELPDQWY